jgi:hypothetical protein
MIKFKKRKGLVDPVSAITLAIWLGSVAVSVGLLLSVEAISIITGAYAGKKIAQLNLAKREQKQIDNIKIRKNKIGG